MTLLWVCIFRFRRITDLSPMVEARSAVWKSVTAVFGEWIGGSPKMEVRIPFSRCVTAVFGDSCVWSPMAEVWWG